MQEEHACLEWDGYLLRGQLAVVRVEHGLATYATFCSRSKIEQQCPSSVDALWRFGGKR
jgi:hypothetical protein